MKIDYTNLSFTQLIDKIESNRFFDIPRMVREAFTRLLTRVEALEATPSGGIESITGDFVDNTDPLNPVLNDPRPYKVYTALLSQSGTDAPVATVLENTLGGDIVWSRENVGMYIASLVGAFTINKLTVSFGDEQILGAKNHIILNKEYSDINDLYIETSSDNFETKTDNLFRSTSIEIRVYN